MKVLQAAPDAAVDRSWRIGMRVRCPNCASLLEIEHGDPYWPVVAGRAPIWVHCARCRHRMRISPEEAAIEIKDAAE